MSEVELVQSYFNSICDNFDSAPGDTVQGYVLGACLSSEEPEMRQTGIDFVNRCREICKSPRAAETLLETDAALDIKILFTIHKIESDRQELPEWMDIDRINELGQTLQQTIDRQPESDDLPKKSGDTNEADDEFVNFSRQTAADLAADLQQSNLSTQQSEDFARRLDAWLSYVRKNEVFQLQLITACSLLKHPAAAKIILDCAEKMTGEFSEEAVEEVVSCGFERHVEFLIKILHSLSKKRFLKIA